MLEKGINLRQCKRDRKGLTARGRDEMNLAEFPIAVLSSRPDPCVKTLQFEDRTWDKGQEEWVSRRLTVSASDNYGLPTSLDDDVILGLIQLTREDDFQNRRVFFSRYHLLRTLGWRDDGKSYARLETALKRWLGVTLYYEKAWWDKAAQSWVDENFHLLEQISLYDRGRRLQCSGSDEPALSMFVWNEVVFRSFKAGNLKQVDMELYRRLSNPIAKRLYRFLDKRFYHAANWQFDLRELACEHVGLSRCYDPAGLKRKLRPAIAELEEVGFLSPRGDDARFERIQNGTWQVQFDKGRTSRHVPMAADTESRTKRRLLERGVNPATITELLSISTPQEIEGHIEVFDWIMAQSGRPAPKNPAGYLVESIRRGYAPPRGYHSPSAKSGPRKASEVALPKTSGPRPTVSESMRKRVEQYLKSLPPSSKDSFQQKALKTASDNLKKAYHRAVTEQSPLLVDLYRRLALEEYVARVLRGKSRSTRSGNR